MGFRAKKLPQDVAAVPRAGIHLLKEGVVFIPVAAADFRTHEIPFDSIFKTVKIFTSKLPPEEKLQVQNSWDRLRDSMESTERRSYVLTKMDILQLPKQTQSEISALPSYLQETTSDKVISGNLCDESVDEGDLDEICEKMDVCVYTSAKVGRPWVGRVKEMLPGNRFIIQWYSRSGRGKIFQAMKCGDESPNLSELSMETIMFWNMSESRKDESFTLSNFWLENMKVEYSKIDGLTRVSTSTSLFFLCPCGNCFRLYMDLND